MSALPTIFTPVEVARHLGVAERTVRERARAIGACRIIGKKTIMTEGDVALFMEAIRPCPSQSTSAVISGITGAPSPDGDFAALQALRTKQSPSGSRQKPKRGSGSGTSTGRGRM